MNSMMAGHFHFVIFFSVQSINCCSVILPLYSGFSATHAFVISPTLPLGSGNPATAASETAVAGLP